MTQEHSAEKDTPADGFCPYCKALMDEACSRPDGSPREDHRARHPYPVTASDMSVPPGSVPE